LAGGDPGGFTMADASSQACLTVLGGSLSGTRFVIEDAVDNILIGSDPSCRFCLPVPGISPIHARLWIDVAGATIYDTNSPRGLYVNDDRVNGQLPLKNGDILWLGTPGEEEVVMIQCRLPGKGTQPEEAAEPATSVAAAALVDKETMVLGREASPPREPTPDVLALEPEVGGTEALEVVPEPLAVEEEPVRFSFTPEPGPLRPPAHFEVDIEESGSRSAATLRMAAGLPPQVAPDRAEAPVPEEPTVVIRSPAAAAPPASPPRAPAPVPPTPVGTRDRAAAPPAARKPVVERTPPPAPRAAASSSSGLRYALLGGAALLLLGGGAFMVLNLGSSPDPQVATASPPPPAVPATQPAAAPAVAPELVAPEPEPSAPPPEPAPVLEEVIPVAAPSAQPSAAASAAASRPPSAAPPARPRPGAPSPAAPASPSAQAPGAQQVAALMGQAEKAVAAGRHENASSLYDDVLKLEPQNAAATAGKARAQAALALSRRSFVTGRTQVQTEKVDKSLSGFETEGVSLQKAPDFLGKLEFEVSPARVAPGTAYRVKVYVTNQGKKSIRIRGIAVGTTVNGTRSPSPASTAVKAIDPQERVLLTEVGGQWEGGTTAWSMDVQVTANRGDSLKSQVVWR